jgi:hypothetical protein
MVIMSDAAVRERQPADFVNVALERLVEALLELHGSPPRTEGATAFAGCSGFDHGTTHSAACEDPRCPMLLPTRR